MSFLGIGVKPPEVSLGYMMSESQSYMVRAPWYMLTCGSVIVLLILGVSLIGEGLQQKKWGGSAMLEIKDLHVQFHTSDHEAVRGIDLTVQDGEIMGLVGESGSGKTVTAMMVSGLLRPEQADFRGRILLDGEDLLHAGGQRIRAIQGKDICVVFQEPMSAMDPTMRIGKQVEGCLRVHTDLSAQERRQRAPAGSAGRGAAGPGGGLSQVPP